MDNLGMGVSNRNVVDVTRERKGKGKDNLGMGVSNRNVVQIHLPNGFHPGCYYAGFKRRTFL